VVWVQRGTITDDFSDRVHKSISSFNRKGTRPEMHEHIEIEGSWRIKLRREVREKKY